MHEPARMCVIEIQRVDQDSINEGSGTRSQQPLTT
jgi:hypothetical protein